MKVLVINNYFSNKGGADVCTYAMGNLLKTNGHEVIYYATDSGPLFEEDYKYRHYFPQGVDYKKLSRWELLRKNLTPFYNVDAERNLAALIRETRPDIVHCHCIFYTLSPSVLKACYDAKLPVVMTLHGPQLMCPAVKMMKGGDTYCRNEDCVGGNVLPCVTNRCVDKSLVKSAGIAAEYLFRKAHGLYNKIDAFISPSQGLLELAVRSGIPRQKLHRVYNFVPDELLNTVPDGRPGRYFLYVGRLSREKGVHYLLQAMAALPQCRLHIVGTGPDEATLKQQAEGMKLGNVSFLGFQSGEGLETQFRECIATVLPCNWFENFPTSIIETFIYGKPAIGSHIGGIPEMIEDGHTGLTFEPGNVDQLIAALETLHNDPDKALEMGRNARQKAETEYHSSLYYQKLMAIYGPLLQTTVSSR